MLIMTLSETADRPGGRVTGPGSDDRPPTDLSGASTGTDDDLETDVDHGLLA